MSEMRSSLEMIVRLSTLIRDAQAVCMGQINEIVAFSAEDDNDIRPESSTSIVDIELPATPPIFRTERFSLEDPYASIHLDFFLDDY